MAPDWLVDLERWTNQVVWVVMAAFELWAVVDCATRKAAAFPAASKLTKPAWLAITLGAAVFGVLFQAPMNPISLIAIIAALVYLVDVRPAVRDLSGGRY